MRLPVLVAALLSLLAVRASAQEPGAPPPGSCPAFGAAAAPARDAATAPDSASDATGTGESAMGCLRLRVVDTRSGEVVLVSFAVTPIRPDGRGMTAISYDSGEKGWGRWHEFEAGTYDLHVYQFRCDGKPAIAADWVTSAPETASARVEIGPGARVERELRMDVCAVRRYVEKASP
jgi:hypothetical protein